MITSIRLGNFPFYSICVPNLKKKTTSAHSRVLPNISILSGLRPSSSFFQTGVRNHRRSTTDATCQTGRGWNVPPPLQKPTLLFAQTTNSVLAISLPEALSRLSLANDVHEARVSRCLATAAFQVNGKIERNFKCHGPRAVWQSLRCWLFRRLKEALYAEMTSGPIRTTAISKTGTYTWTKLKGDSPKPSSVWSSDSTLGPFHSLSI